MMRLDAVLARPAVRQDGLATREQLRLFGLTDEAIDHRVGAGILIRVQPGVYRHAAAPFTERTRLRAALLACGSTAVVSHRSAAVLHDVDGIQRIRPEITVVGTSLPRLNGVTIHRTKLLPAADRTIVAGLPVTAKGRTFLDLGAVLPFEVVQDLVHTSLITKVAQTAELIAVLERVGRRGRDGTGVLRAIMADELPDERLQSMLEAALLRLIRRSSAPAPELQHRLELPDGAVAVLDFAWPDRKIAVEADGLRWHGTKAQMERDNARSRSIQRLGWSHHRYGWGPVHESALGVVSELDALFAGSVSR